jgi:O-acetyl-ADP-ribose deacetylase (regulator of RNase III)
MDTRATLFEDRLVVAVGDITAFTGDALVNAANSTLLGGGGVDGAIHRAAGASLIEECRAIRTNSFPDGLPPGQAVATGAGDLHVDRIIHTVGPVWHGGADDEEDLLRSCYRSSLALARDLSIASIAIPAISTGVYAYPRELAARVAFAEVVTWLEDHDLPSSITLVFYSHDDADVFLESIG